MSAPKKLRLIFDHAIEIESETEREEYVDKECAGDAELKAKVEALIRAHFEADSFLQPVIELESSPTLHEAKTQLSMQEEAGPGTTIGQYKLLEQIGTGGFGRVFLAEQLGPVRRQVAIKLIKPGMDSADVIARFNQERQAMAMMDHSSIAAILDAGTTDLGRPYFVMEYVEGTPITQYCDEHLLTTQERLRLFVSVCKAVQHAHQKGVIHRDLKPSNILVTSQTADPVCKIIDFGIAKAIGPSITTDSIRTGQGVLIGTPRYMSPEQAALSGIDIDARSDIYSLGVVLYELLTGTTPINLEVFQEIEFDEFLRRLREQDLPKPSTRLNESVETLHEVARHRKISASRLVSLVKGDLDWIVIKALEKEPERRYESVDALGCDVQRYLEDEPIEARPPSSSYRAKKFFKKNRLAVGFSLAMACVLAIATCVSVWQAIRANRNEADAVAALHAEKKAKAIAVAALAAERKAKQEAFIEKKSAEEARRTTSTMMSLGMNRDRSFSGSLEGGFGNGGLLSKEMNRRLERASGLVNEYDQDGRVHLVPVQAIGPESNSNHFKPFNIDTTHANALAIAGQFKEAQLEYINVLDDMKQELGEEHELTFFVSCQLAEAYRANGDSPEALELMRKTLAGATDVFGPKNRRTAIYTYWLARVLESAEQYEEALDVYKQGFRLLDAALGRRDFLTAEAKLGLGRMYAKHNKPELAALFTDSRSPIVSITMPEHGLPLGTSTRPPTPSLRSATLESMNNFGKRFAMLEAMRQIARTDSEHEVRIFFEKSESLMTKSLNETIKQGLQYQFPKEIRFRHQQAILKSLLELSSIASQPIEKAKWEEELKKLDRRFSNDDIIEIERKSSSCWTNLGVVEILTKRLKTNKGHNHRIVAQRNKAANVLINQTEATLVDALNGSEELGDDITEKERLDLQRRIIEGLVRLYSIADEPEEKAKWENVLKQLSEGLGKSALKAALRTSRNRTRQLPANNYLPPDSRRAGETDSQFPKSYVDDETISYISFIDRMQDHVSQFGTDRARQMLRPAEAVLIRAFDKSEKLGNDVTEKAGLELQQRVIEGLVKLYSITDQPEEKAEWEKRLKQLTAKTKPEKAPAVTLPESAEQNDK